MGKILNVTASLLAALIITLSSCNTSGCTDNQSSIPLAGFYSYNTLREISVDSISVGGVGAINDSLLINSASASKVYLPFRANQDSTSYFIRYEAKNLNYPELFDTITFKYKRIPYFASEECGAMYRYSIDKLNYTTHLIDSVGLVDSLITNADIETIRIYFRTEEKPNE